jgi:hypothetical protein
MEKKTSGKKRTRRNHDYAHGSKSALRARDEYLERIKWKPHEDEVIKNNHKNHSDSQISRDFLPHRTPKSIRRRRHSMKCHKKPSHQIWTEKELELLYLHWKDYDQRELKEKFFPNKTVQQVRNAKMHRGLKKPPVWTNEERGLLVDHGANYSRVELQELFFPDKTKDQISGMRKHLGIKRNLSNKEVKKV